MVPDSSFSCAWRRCRIGRPSRRAFAPQEAEIPSLDDVRLDTREATTRSRSQRLDVVRQRAASAGCEAIAPVRIVSSGLNGVAGRHGRSIKLAAMGFHLARDGSHGAFGAFRRRGGLVDGQDQPFRTSLPIMVPDSSFSCALRRLAALIGESVSFSVPRSLPESSHSAT